jgi:hypothetical protein
LTDTYTDLKENINASADHISSWSWSSTTPHKPANTIIIKADVSALPQNILITEAKLYLFQTDAFGEDGYNNSVHKITGKNPVISQVNGKNPYTGGTWTPVPAGTTEENVPLGLADIAAAEDTIAIGSQEGYRSWNITDMVQDWVNNPAANYGLLIAGESTASEAGRTFAATENQESDLRPKLEIYYIKKPPTPNIISAKQISQ